MGIRGSTVDDIISGIPTYAKRRELTPVKGKVEKGFEYHRQENGDGVILTYQFKHL
ncbi:polymorphic toxin type 30 domain-containing protein [Brevibacillus formosus]|uniref:polymorphic toxin type 30 domain-containing protein n=1 Tax=Brevibacillus formosus TaxID=54913 RepID=UPI003F1B43EB